MNVDRLANSDTVPNVPGPGEDGSANALIATIIAATQTVAQSERWSLLIMAQTRQQTLFRRK
jgi:hypothetical protein